MNQNILNIKQSALEHLRETNPLFVKLCQPLHDIGIHNYYFIKCHEDGTYLFYAKRRELAEMHIQTLRSQSQFFMDSVDITPHNQIFSLTGDIHQFDLKRDPVIKLFWEYDCWNTFMLYRIINNNLLEGWGFSVGRGFLDPLGFFLKKKHLLERFVNYFDIVAKDIINTEEKRKLAVYDDRFTFFDRSYSEVKNHDLLFLRQTRLNKLFINDEEQHIHFTQRQCECLYYLSQHQSTKQIAQFLNLSHRSVETYIQTIKSKIGVSSKSDLLKFIHRHELTQKLELFKRI